MRKLLLLFFISSAILFAQWIPQNSNTTVALNTVFFTDSVTGIVAGNGGTILKTTDGGVNWIQKSSGTTRDIQSLKFFDANLGFAAGKFIILKTTDGGNTWNSVYYNTTSLLNDITFIDSLTWISVGASAELPDMKILKTTNCGLSWNLIIQGDVSLNAVCFTGINGLAAGWDGRIYKSTDSGDTWSQVVSGTSYQLFCVYNINPDDAIAAGFEILKSTNGEHPGHLCMFLQWLYFIVFHSRIYMPELQ